MKFNSRTLSLYAMILLYLIAGTNHFINPEFYENIMPSYIPFHKVLVFLSGICEMAFAVLLIPTLTRKIAAWLIAAMLIVFFVIHIDMIISYLYVGGFMLWIAIFRFLLQFILIWWALLFTKNPHPPVANEDS